MQQVSNLLLWFLGLTKDIAYRQFQLFSLCTSLFLDIFTYVTLQIVLILTYWQHHLLQSVAHSKHLTPERSKITW